MVATQEVLECEDIESGVVDLGQVGRWERGTHQPRSGGESRRAVT